MADSFLQWHKIQFHDGLYISLVGVSPWSQITLRGIANKEAG